MAPVSSCVVVVMRMRENMGRVAARTRALQKRGQGVEIMSEWE